LSNGEIVKEELVDYLYYQKLPEVYRVEDLAQKPKLPFYKYLQSCGAGFDDILDSINGLMFLTDPMNCPDEFLPVLMECFGLNYSEDIEPKYQRKLLSNIGILFKRRGTSNCVKYLVRTLANLNASIDYNPDTRILQVTLLSSTMDDFINMATSRKVITRYLQDFLPYYCNVNYDVIIDPQELQSTIYRAQVITQKTIYYTIPEGEVE
jgi:hypothetical protein